MTVAVYPEYDNYRVSDRERLDFLIPSHWISDKARFLFRFNKGLTITKENLQNEGIPCVNYGEIHSKFGFEVDPGRHELKFVSPEYLKANRGALLRRGDFVFADTSEDIEGSGNFTHLDSDEPTFAGYHTLIARPLEKAQTRYLAYMLDSEAFRKQVQQSVKGVKVYSISQGLLKNLEVLLPPLTEQRAIAAFLDGKCATIDEAVRIKEEQIKLLRERRQILIQRAITRGLNPDVPMKDSGIDWIGEVPAHWEVRKVKKIFRLAVDAAEKNNSHELLSIYTDIGVRPRKDLEERGNKASTTDGYWLVQKGDFIVNKLLAWMGAIGLSEYDGVTSPAYDILRPRALLNGHYFHRLFRSKSFSLEIKRFSRGIMEMRLRIYFDKLGVLEVPFPPKTEQDEIIAYLNQHEQKIEQAISIKQDQIDTLKEYKASLVNAAVTGEIKVI